MSTSAVPKTRRALQARRKAVGKTQEDMARLCGVSLGTYQAWEQGRNKPVPGHRVILARHLGVDLPQVAVWLDDPDGATPLQKRPVPKWLGTYAALEQGAGTVQAYEAIIVQGLLQTRAYATALEQAMGGGDVDGFVRARMERQGALRRRLSRLHLAAVMDESVLRREVGNGEIMADQLAHLVTLSTWANVDIRIIPLRSRAVFPASSFSLLTAVHDADPFMACVSTVGSIHYLDHDVHLSQHAKLFRTLSDVALPPDQTVELIEATIKEHYS
jgi:transcriptional regulator with XRE-family HTH domain